ncbi:protein Diedel-like [Drosophila busckii]|uniref:protein Diedel-like n=1 Tax=Drosophila busckii TaxID=30019 RepID=UPI001432B70A|nr:protein Diedel-like [Drosophila busckii]
MTLKVTYLVTLLAPVAQAECCVDAKTIVYKLSGGSCGDIGGSRQSDGTCRFKICANGEGIRGTYCGQGSCDIVGCKCDGGCLRGNWEDSFKAQNAHLNPEVIEVHWATLSLIPAPEGGIPNYLSNLFVNITSKVG